MSLFVYSAAKQDGTLSQGQREAEDEKALAQTLKQEGLLLLRAKEEGRKEGLLGIRINAGELIAYIRPISLVEKMFFSRNLSVMLKAGLSLTRALEASVEESTNPRFKKVVLAVLANVVKGKTFADSLKLHPKVFNELYVNMVEVGETTGKLSLVLKLMANQMKKDHELRSRVRGAMMYPAIIVVALIGIGSMMMIYVVPTLADTIRQLGTELPLSTRIVLGISDVIVHYAIWTFMGVFAFVALCWRALKSQFGKTLFDRTVLKIPIFGGLVGKFNMARFSRTLAYLVTSGVPIVHSLEITAKVLGNTNYRAAVLHASQDIQKGKQLNEILHGYPGLFHPMVIQMVKVGEETGKISDMLLRLALFFEEDVNNATKNLSSLIEPILMLIIGAIVGFFAISMLQPIYGSLGNI